MKLCIKCNIEKIESEFYKRSDIKDGLRKECKLCTNLKTSNYRINNKNKILEYSKKYYYNNSKKVIQRTYTYRIKNKNIVKNWKSSQPQEIKKRNKTYYIKNKNKILKSNIEYEKNKHNNNIYFKLLKLLRCRIKNAVKLYNKSTSSLNLIGCSLKYLKEHLQQTAINNGYKDFDINNYSGKDYHIDHIIPCSIFNLKCSYHQKLCFNYKNLQILTAKENLEKSDNLIKD